MYSGECQPDSGDSELTSNSIIFVAAASESEFDYTAEAIHETVLCRLEGDQYLQSTVSIGMEFIMKSVMTRRFILYRAGLGKGGGGDLRYPLSLLLQEFLQPVTCDQLDADEENIFSCCSHKKCHCCAQLLLMSQKFLHKWFLPVTHRSRNIWNGGGGGGDACIHKFCLRMDFYPRAPQELTGCKSYFVVVLLLLVTLPQISNTWEIQKIWELHFVRI